MTQTCSTVTDVWWNGLGAALVGGLTAALVATGVVVATRAYERRHVKEQEARAAARELLKDTDTYLNALNNALSGSREDVRARDTAHWRWLAAIQAAQASLRPVSPELVERINEAARRSQAVLLAVQAASEAIGSPARDRLMPESMYTISKATLRLRAIIANWIGTGEVYDFDEESQKPSS